MAYEPKLKAKADQDTESLPMRSLGTHFEIELK